MSSSREPIGAKTAPCGCVYALEKQYGTRGEAALNVVVDRHRRCDGHSRMSPYLASASIAKQVNA